MIERSIPYFGYAQKTKNKILDVAIKLFALNGYNAVTMKDISQAVGIRTGSLYTHYTGKEAIIEDALSRFEKEYKNYFNWLIEENAKATTLEEVMDNMFAELLKVRELSTYYGISLLLREQFKYEGARVRLTKLIYEDSINWMQTDFDRLMEKGIIPKGNSRTIATIIMWCVLIGNDMRIHESIGCNLPFSCTEMYGNLKTFLTDVLRKGV